MKSRRIAAAAGLAVLAVSLTACGSDSKNDGGGGDLTESNFAATISEATADEESVHIGGPIVASGTSFGVDGDMVLAGDSTQMNLALDGGQLGTIEMIVIDESLYIKGSQMTQLAEDPSKSWVQVDATDDNPFAKAFDGIFDQADPSKLSGALASVKDLEKVGTEQIGGVETTHYAVTVDTADMADAQGADPELLESAGVPKTADVDVWLDGENRPARFQLDLGDAATIDLSFTDWGKDVDVSAPPASDVTTFKSLG